MGKFTPMRQRLAAFIGGFEGGLSARRLKGFHASRAHVNTLIQASGSDMTARAHFLIRNNGYAVNAVESFCGNVVGTGIKPSSGIADAALKDAVQKLWLRWTDESDAEGLTDFYGQQRRAARELFFAGEVFFRFRPRLPADGLSVPLQLQMLPSEMLPLHDNRVLPGGNVVRQGIEFDCIGRRVAPTTLQAASRRPHGAANNRRASPGAGIVRSAHHRPGGSRTASRIFPLRAGAGEAVHTGSV